MHTNSKYIYFEFLFHLFRYLSLKKKKIDMDINSFVNIGSFFFSTELGSKRYSSSTLSVYKKF